MTDAADARRLGPPPPLASVHADGATGSARSRSSSPRPRAARSSTRTAGATSTACRRSGATSTATAIRALDDALRAQLDRVAHTTLLGLANVPSIELARALVAVAPPGLTRVFYSDAGATAVEVALRMALQYHQLRGEPARTRFASLVEAYHGDTLGAVGVGYSETFHRFVAAAVARGGAPDAAARVPLAARHGRRRPRSRPRSPRPSATLAAHGPTLAAVIVEPLVQGAAGMWMHPPAYLRARPRRSRARHGTLLIADEVATGFGRTGHDVRVRARRHHARPHVPREGHHAAATCRSPRRSRPRRSSTRSSAPYEEFRSLLPRPHLHREPARAAPSASRASPSSARSGRSSASAPKIARLRERLAADVAPLPHVGDVRQQGMMVGIELVADRSDARRRTRPRRASGSASCAPRARAASSCARSATSIVLMPPLAIVATELDRLVDVTRDAIVEATAA